MPKVTNEDNIIEKLEYIGLDLENIPNFLLEHKKLEYRPLKVIEENENMYKVYNYVQISKIQILLTRANRLNTIKEKYTKSDELSSYINPKKDEDIINYTTFLKMLKEVKIEEIEKIEEQQKKLNKQIPYKVKFDENYLWQIYYSDISDTYFMLVTTEDLEYASFFYLLKKQIECKKNKKEEMIYVPIVHQRYSGEYLKESEIQDIEKYLWVFTKQWPNIYEVYDKNNQKSIHIVGDTYVYENILTPYKIILNSKEESNKLYKLIKALFILQSELPHYYKFNIKLDRYGKLEFEYNKKKIDYDKLVDVLNKEYLDAKNKIISLHIQKEILKIDLDKLKEDSNNKDREYLLKEKQIATYLECKRTFLGRVKYFFKSRKIKKKQDMHTDIVKEEINSIKEDKQENMETNNFIKKEYYTIEDIINIYKELDKVLLIVKNLKQDIQALENKISGIEQKIMNADLYIKEIDSHEKSIFEFWKFANKDENLMLNKANTQEEANRKIEKSYNYEEDIEEIGILIDKAQRNNLNKELTDAVFIATTEVIDVLNNLNEDIIDKSLADFKKEAQETRELFDVENLDIFGNVVEDSSKIKILGSKKHRENKKEKLKILEINKNTTKEEHKEKLNQILKNLKKAINISKSNVSIPIYKILEENQELKGLNTFNIFPDKSIEDIQESSKVLYKINVKEGMNVIYFTNIVFYDNSNKTLPLGIDVEQKCLLDMNNYELVLVNNDEFRWNELVDEYKVKTKKVEVYEYDIVKKTGDNVNDK